MQRRIRLALLVSCFALWLCLAGCAKNENGPTASNAPNNTNNAPNNPQGPGISGVPQSSPSGGSVSSTDVVKASVLPGEAVAGGKAAEVVFRLQVRDGYHINANPPTFNYLKATEVSFNAPPGLQDSDLEIGKPVYPAPVTKSFSFAEKPLAVYEGEVEIKQPIKARAGATKGARQLSFNLRVQACDDKACYPPGTINVPVGLTVK